MLAKEFRIRTPEQYRAVFADSRRASGQLLTVRLRPAEGPAKFGFIVSTKVSPAATVRNTTKRRLRAAVRGLDLTERAGEWVITAHPAAAAATSEQLRDELGQLIERAGKR